MKPLPWLLLALVVIPGAAWLFEVGDETITLAMLSPEVRAELGGGGGATTYDEPDTIRAEGIIYRVRGYFQKSGSGGR